MISIERSATSETLADVPGRRKKNYDYAFRKGIIAMFAQ